MLKPFRHPYLLGYTEKTTISKEFSVPFLASQGPESELVRRDPQFSGIPPYLYRQARGLEVSWYGGNHDFQASCMIQSVKDEYTERG